MPLNPLASNPDARSDSHLARLHPRAIESPEEIRSLLEVARVSGACMTRGLNRDIDREICRIESIDDRGVSIATASFERDSRDRLFLSLDINGSSYFFSAQVEAREHGLPVRIGLPSRVFQRERRSRRREQHSRRLGQLGIGRDQAIECWVLDSTPEGAGVEVRAIAGAAPGRGADVVLRSPGGPDSPGTVRNVSPSEDGWLRLGLSLEPRRQGKLRVESRAELLAQDLPGAATGALRLALGGAQLAFDRAAGALGRTPTASPDSLVEFLSNDGREIRGYLDSWGPQAEQIAVIIPPAWGRTKETLMPLAETLIACFRAAGKAICVLRFDGLDKRGESAKAPGCEGPGQEHLRFTFSQGVRDIQSAVAFLAKRPGGGPRRQILVSFSASSIEARRAVASDSRIDGWVCAVGSADLQSMMRSISGGIDYALGLEQGLSFGVQEILGVSVDMDVAGLDALANRLVYLGDARSDMARISVPVTWIHGKHDAWMDRGRVEDALGCGEVGNRKLLEVPTGHMLKSSSQALKVFQMIALEVASMVGEKGVRPVPPNLGVLKRRQRFERDRLPRQRESLREFWGDYLLGRDRSVGYELMMMTTPYRDLMERQIRALNLSPQTVVADLGSGVGAFWHHSTVLGPNSPAFYLGLDHVGEGFRRAAERDGVQPRAAGVVADLDPSTGSALPVADGSLDAVLASLFLSYVGEPALCLAHIYSALRPGGRLVLSSLRPDADMSKLFVDGVAELEARWEAEVQPLAPRTSFEAATRAYMNQASRLLDLEEAGSFSFWDTGELTALVEEAGFRVTDAELALGDPPQAILVAATKDRS